MLRLVRSTILRAVMAVADLRTVQALFQDGQLEQLIAKSSD